MKISSFFQLTAYGIKTILGCKSGPILGTIILTDKCNLHCKHCLVNNLTAVVHPYPQILAEMQQLYAMGVRILFFCGGETFLWQSQEKKLRDLVVEAKQMGFLIVNVVTNGTFPLQLPEANLILLSLDGDRQRHNIIRGETYDQIMHNIQNSASDNICLYMAINQINNCMVFCNMGKSCTKCGKRECVYKGLGIILRYARIIFQPCCGKFSLWANSKTGIRKSPVFISAAAPLRWLCLI